eukprot:450445_1
MSIVINDPKTLNDMQELQAMSDEEDVKLSDHRTNVTKPRRNKSKYDENENDFTKGYCLVFTKQPEYHKKKPYKVDLIRNTLKIFRNPAMSLDEYVDDGWQSKLQKVLNIPDKKIEQQEEKKSEIKHRKQHKYNLLANFEEANIKYQIESDRIGKYFYVVIAADKIDTELWAEKHKMDVPINPHAAVTIGRDFPDFKLAHRTYIKEDDEKTFTIKLDHVTYEKCDISLWDNIHIAFNTNVKKEIYCQKNGNIITNILYLRVLYEMLSDDTPVGGADFIVEKFLANKYHPLTHFFALNSEENARPKYRRDNSVCFKCRRISDNKKLCDCIRNYYGESVGFYFHFLIHYTKWLYPMAVLGIIWYLIQFAGDKRFGLATPGSSIIVLIAIIWSTMMIENWYRIESKLRFVWGMLRYTETEIPRPSFSGEMIISSETGEYTETYRSGCEYFCKVTFSMSTMLLCICIVVGIVITLFWLRGNHENVRGLTIGIGMANAIQIFIMNKIYTYLAYMLNEWEGHRLQQDYYNNLVIKRII